MSKLIPILKSDAEMLCLLAGQFGYDTFSANTLFDGEVVLLEGGEWSSGGTPCTKKPSTSGVLPDCKKYLPAITFTLFTTVEGSKPVVDFSLQMAKENMIPAFLYTKTKAPNVKIL